MEKELDMNTEDNAAITATEEVQTEMVQVEVKTVEKPAPKAKASKVEATKADAQVKSNKRILQGKVVSNKGDKTIIIKVERQVAHPIYKKYYKKTNKFMAHDENNVCNTGDTVRVRECRPLSARKCWELVEVVERAK